MGRKRLSDGEYREGLIKRHGDEFIEDFDSIFNGDITLSRIAKKHNISKMRASQIFQRLYGSKFSDVKKTGKVEDPSGVTRIFEPGKNRQFVVTIPEELYNEVKAYSESMGLSMASITRDCLNDFFQKDGLTKAYRAL